MSDSTDQPLNKYVPGQYVADILDRLGYKVGAEVTLIEKNCCANSVRDTYTGNKYKIKHIFEKVFEDGKDAMHVEDDTADFTGCSRCLRLDGSKPVDEFIFVRW